jgi:hypothetical protein
MELMSYLPILYLGLQVSFDVFRISKKPHTRQLPGIFMLIGFLTYLSLLFFYGITAATTLLTIRTNSENLSSLLATLIVSLSYHSFRLLVNAHPELLGIDKKGFMAANFQIFLHYFAYTSFSAICFITFTFVILIFT